MSNERILTAEKVSDITHKCLFKDGEDTSNAIKVEGIVSNYGFNPERLEENKEDIHTLLMELPASFMESSGGGMSFLQACMDKHDRQWGEHRNMEELFLLGIAAGFVKCLLPREIWPALPGGVPYYVVLDQVSVSVEKE